MQVLRSIDRVATRWKNGGGFTWDYATHPEGAGFEDFYWRVSRARVDAQSAFSAYPGIDRTLALIEGRAIDLMMPDRHVRLDRTTPPYRFAGDLPVDCRIPAGPVENLDIMTRRGRWANTVERHAVDAPIGLTLGGDVNVLVALAALRVTSADHPAVDLAWGDALVLEGATTATVEPLDGSADLVAIRLDHIRAQWTPDE